MMIVTPNIINNKEYFDKIISNCCETLLKNKDKIYDLMKDRTSCVNISFDFIPNELVSMNINWKKYVYEETEHNKKINI